MEGKIVLKKHATMGFINLENDGGIRGRKSVHYADVLLA
jgi:hypothetical protein